MKAWEKPFYQVGRLVAIGPFNGGKEFRTAAFSGLLFTPPTEVFTYSASVSGCLQFVLSASIRLQACAQVRQLSPHQWTIVGEHPTALTSSSGTNDLNLNSTMW